MNRKWFAGIWMMVVGLSAAAPLAVPQVGPLDPALPPDPPILPPEVAPPPLLLPSGDATLFVEPSQRGYERGQPVAFDFWLRNNMAKDMRFDTVEVGAALYGPHADLVSLDPGSLNPDNVTVDAENLTVNGFSVDPKLAVNPAAFFIGSAHFDRVLVVPPGSVCLVYDGMEWSQDLPTEPSQPAPPGGYLLAAVARTNDGPQGEGESFAQGSAPFLLGLFVPPLPVASPWAGMGPPCFFEDMPPQGPGTGVEGEAAVGSGPVPSQVQPSAAETLSHGTAGAEGYRFWTPVPYWPTMPFTWHYNSAGAPAVAGIVTALTNGMQRWEDDTASYFDATYGGTTTTGYSLGDGKSVVVWKTGMGSTLGVAECSFPATGAIKDCDIKLNSASTWDTSGAPPAGATDLESVTTHEFGHWVPILDLGRGADSTQTMYGTTPAATTHKRTLEWGDKSGIRYDYPTRYTSVTTGLGWENQGIDVAAGSLDGDAMPDVVTAWVDNPYCENTIYYKVGFDVSSTTGAAASWSGVFTAVPTTATGTRTGVGCESQGLGVALGSIDNTAAPDLLVAWVDNPSGANKIHYRIGWNLGATGAAASWSSIMTFAPGQWVGHETQGAGVCIASIGGTTRPDVLVAWMDNPSGSNTLKYRIGWDITTAGGLSTYTGTTTSATSVSSTWFGWESQGVGVACADLTGGNIEVTFAWMDNPSGSGSACENHPYYVVGLNIPTGGTISSWENYKKGPGTTKEWWGCENQGLGLTPVQLDGSSEEEFIFAWVDNPSGANTAYYREEWNARYHGHT